MKLKAVIFDWAGTMVDFGSLAPVSAMRRAFSREGIELSDGDIRAGMGLAKIDHVRAILAAGPVRGAWVERAGAPPSDADCTRIFTSLEPLMREEGAARAELIPGAAQAAMALREAGVRIGSTTGYTRTMMAPILPRAAAQGYAPELVVCAGETKQGRPSPLMIWKALVDMGVYPADAVVKVDDAPAGIGEGKAAGCFTIGVAASGNAMGLDRPVYEAMAPASRGPMLEAARAELYAAGADKVIDSVADLYPLLKAEGFI